MAAKIVHLLVFYVIHDVYCDWASDWMAPVEDQLSDNPAGRIIKDEDAFSFPITQNTMLPVDIPTSIYSQQRVNNYDMSMTELKLKLASTLSNARTLADTLKSQIFMLSSRETTLKDAIVNGRSGVSTVSVTTLRNSPRTYIVRDGFWSLCNGVVQHPVGHGQTNLFGDVLSIPRCIGQEVTSVLDPCVFNSIIKYETVPTRRRLEYSEDDYLCLKNNFNTTMEQYLSVPRQVVNATCRNGAVRSVAEITQLCGSRILSEYTYYPQRSSAVAAMLPLEYCEEKNGACNLMVAWHVSNKTIENFEFFKDEKNFKKLFLKSGPFVEHIL